MSDRELLEAAAKAGGIVGEYECWAGQGFIEGIRQVLNGAKCHRPWNSLTDDGDALRLAVALNIGVQCHMHEGSGYALASHSNQDAAHAITVEPGDCPYAATRRAITRAAAAIGGAA